MGDNKISEAVDAFIGEVASKLDDAGLCLGYYERFRSDVRDAVMLALPHLQGEAVPVACIHPDTLAMLKSDRRADRAACSRWSDIKQMDGYVPLYTHPQPAELSEVPPELAEAIAAGNGTLHGAIDYWQDRALAAEAKLSEVSGDSGELPPLPAPKYLAKLSKDGEWAELTVMPDWSAEMWAWGTDEVFSKQQMQDYARAALNQSGK